MAGLSVRYAEPMDGAAVSDIYAYHVAHSTATFDTVAPDREEMAERIAHVRGRGWPFLVAERDHLVVGYAYATQFRDRAAYLSTCEDSIYVKEAERSKGVGVALLQALLAEAETAGFRQMIAVVGGSEPASVALHERCGFVHAGRLHHVGRKFDRWLDTVYMQRQLGFGSDVTVSSGLLSTSQK
jgi:L-amino acid N-acyltransferase YncA